MEDFEFAAWCIEYELDKDTQTLFLEKGFNSYKSLSRLPMDSIKKDFKGLLPAQVYLLQDAVALLQPQAPKAGCLPAPPAPQDQPDNITPAAQQEAPALATGISATEIMQFWQRHSGAAHLLQPAIVPSQAPGKISPEFDPYLLGCGPYANKFRRAKN